MPDRSPDNERPENTKRSKRLLWSVITIVLAVVLCVLFLGVLLYESVDEKLAAIDAARTIPNSENAAAIYNQVFTDYVVQDMPPGFNDPRNKIRDLTLRQPWRSEDCPEIAKWIEQQQEVMGKLIEASRLDKCWFPITDNAVAYVPIPRIRRAQAAKRWAYLLARAANNDVAEGQMQSAIEKYRAIMQLGRHFHQQPVLTDFLIGVALENLSMQELIRFVVQDAQTQSQIKIIENSLPQPEINRDEKSATIFLTQRWFDSRLSLVTRIKYWVQLRWTGGHLPDRGEVTQRIHQAYSRLIAGRRAATIAIALRRHKHKTGKWPTNLAEVESLAPAKIFIDPINGGSFAYKLAGETFKLYSKGQNKIDEDGQYNSESDPNTFQETVKEDDILFWPPKMPKKKEENTDDK